MMLNSCPSCSKQRAREEALLGERVSGSFDVKASSASAGWVGGWIVCLRVCVAPSSSCRMGGGGNASERGRAGEREEPSEGKHATVQ